MKLYKHQQALVDLAPDKYLLAHETGTGKTITAIELVKLKTDNCLVICPKSLVKQWQEQVSWSVLSKEQFKKQVKTLKRYDAIIVDEIHYFGNYKSQLTKSLLFYIKYHQPKFLYGLTATPYLSSVWNIYSYGLIFGKPWKWYAWSNKFFTQVKMGARMIPVQKTKVDGRPIEEVVSKLVSQLGNTVRMSDCVDLPDQIFETEYFDLTPSQNKVIEELTDVLPIVRFTKIHQICGGSLKGDGYVEDKFFDSNKLDRLLDLCRDNEKVVVVCRYNNELAFIAQKLAKVKSTFIINGSVKDRHKVVQEANSCQSCVVLVQASCSEGYSLETFPVMVFYSYDFSLKNKIQMLGRVQRINNIKKNAYISLIVKNTIDEDIYKCLEKKEDFHIEIYGK
jgi:superfamily II DNA or RNA helicase